MTTEYTIPLDDGRATLEVAGGKGASLARLATTNLPVPGGFHVTTEAYQQFVAENDLQPRILAALETADPSRTDALEATSQTIRELFSQAEMPPAIAGAVARAYASLVGDNPHVAVRSSATAEDLPGLSFAGQQETYLNVQGAAAVLEAVQRCWASLWTARAIGYRTRHSIDQGTVSLAVVVQLLVPAEAAGIMFTANPVTGARSEAMISASWGLGEAVVGGLVTPDSLTVDKRTGEMLARETADKQVMTVRVQGGTEEQPVPDVLRDVPVLDDDRAAELVRLGVQIEQLYGIPMDIEWCWADGQFFIVQARPITALPEQEAPVPTEWPLPDPKGKYVRASVVELLPDPLTPLFATLGRAAINAGTKRLGAELAGSESGWPDETVVTINDYAYYSAQFTPRQILRLLTRGPFTMTRMMRQAEVRWCDVVRPRYMETIQKWQARPLNELPAEDILIGVRQIADASFDVYALYQSALFPNANISEVLFTRVYDRLIRREDDPPALTYVLGFDSTPILAEKSLYDIAVWCRTRPALVTYVSSTPTGQLAAQLEDGRAPSGVVAEDWQEWQSRFRAHLEEYGHIIYSLDFADPLPADDPTPLLDTCKSFLNDQCANPYERQQAAAERREQATQAMLKRLKGLRLALFRRLVTWAQKGVPMREEGLSGLGLGYPQLRRMLLELGRRLVQAGAVEEPGDVFWLFQDEAEKAAGALDKSASVSPMAGVVEQRKAVWQAEKRATPPPVLPPKSKFMGMDLDMYVAAQDGDQVGDTIRGAGTSPGRVTGAARVLYGPEDFDQMETGDILVAVITTPAWTPLFARAAAVVTDIGGQLSHGSIVAREYGIPAVMGTGVATKRIRSGQTITVDGSTGEVVLHTAEAGQTPPAVIEWKLPNPKGKYMRASIIDLMPDPISPLFATMGMKDYDAGLARTMSDVTRSKAVLPSSFVTINDYAYSNTQATGREMWWVVTRMVPALPRMMRVGVSYWRENGRAPYVETVRRWEGSRPLAELSASDLLDGAGEIARAAMYNLTAQMVWMGACAGSEMLFVRVYDRLIQRDGEADGTTFLMGYDSTPIRAEKSLYDLAEWCCGRDALAAHVLSVPSDQIVAQLENDRVPPGVAAEDWQVFRERFRAHVEQFGHIIYNLDFSKPLPLDDPAPMVEMIKLYLRGKGANPHERQGSLESRRVQMVETVMSRVRGLKRWAFTKTLRWAQSLAEIREDALADIGLGYPVLRRILRELGGRLVDVGTVEQPDDVFWLRQEELEQAVAALERGEIYPGMVARIRERRAFSRAAKQVTPPPVLPASVKKVMGISVKGMVAAGEESHTEDMIKGAGTSAGQVTAPACVLHGPEDFSQMEPGRVLVASITTPAWTPLFAMAAGVVTDIGGPLSHGSIVAREYGIPAVLGTGVATNRIRSGQRITVDGTAGTVTLLEG